MVSWHELAALPFTLGGDALWFGNVGLRGLPAGCEEMLDDAVLVADLFLEVKHVPGERVGLPEHHVEQCAGTVPLAVLHQGLLGGDNGAETPRTSVSGRHRLLLAIGRARQLGALALLRMP